MKRRSSMIGIPKRVSQLLGWPSAQLRSISEQVALRLEASSQASRARYMRAREERAAKAVEVSPGPAEEE